MRTLKKPPCPKPDYVPPPRCGVCGTWTKTRPESELVMIEIKVTYKNTSETTKAPIKKADADKILAYLGCAT